MIYSDEEDEASSQLDSLSPNLVSNYRRLKELRQQFSELGNLSKIRCCPDLIVVSYDCLEGKIGFCQLKMSIDFSRLGVFNHDCWATVVNVFSKNGGKRVTQSMFYQMRGTTELITMLLNVDVGPSSRSKLTFPILVQLWVRLQNPVGDYKVDATKLVAMIKQFEVGHLSFPDEEVATVGKLDAAQEIYNKQRAILKVNKLVHCSKDALKNVSPSLPDWLSKLKKSSVSSAQFRFLDQIIIVRMLFDDHNKNAVHFILEGDLRAVANVRCCLIKLLLSNRLAVDSARISPEVSERSADYRSMLEEVDDLEDLKTMYICIRQSISANLPIL